MSLSSVRAVIYCIMTYYLLSIHSVLSKSFLLYVVLSYFLIKSN